MWGGNPFHNGPVEAKADAKADAKAAN